VRQWHKDNHEHCLEVRRAYRKKNRAKLKHENREYYLKRRAKWLEFFEQHCDMSCSKCGYSKSKVALDFHHRDPSKKKFGITEKAMVSIVSEEMKALVLTEIKKCDVLCANCHRILHFEENNK
jgi:hypothetical protein